MKCNALTKKRNAMDATDHASIQCENQIAFNTSRGNSNSMIGFDNSLCQELKGILITKPHRDHCALRTLLFG